MILSLLLIALTTLNGQFGKNKVQVERSEWNIISTLHFDIYYPKGADDFGKTVALMAEEAYYYLQEAFQVPLQQRVPIIFYESHLEFQVTNIIYPLLTVGVGGFTESLRNRVVIPYDGSYKKLEEVLIHELTHAYVNLLDNEFQGGRIFNIQQMRLPFWFDEGLPEYFAVGGEDNYNNMFVMDMVLNSSLQRLETVGGFNAYRLGESFLTYIDEVYGRDYVMRLFYAAKTSGTMDSASQRVFGMSFEDMQKRWHNYLFRKYTPYLNTRNIPYEMYNKRTDHVKDNSYFNFAPRFAPDGNSYLYLSNRNQRMSIWRGMTIDIFEDQLILRGETTGKFEQFHFLRSNISWFPDSQHFAFVAKTKVGDVIYVMDVQSKEVTYSYEMFDFDAVYEIDICPQGNMIVFAGQKEFKNNIYYMDLDTNEIETITNDSYYDHQPRWSNDGNKIVFTSERKEKIESKYDHIFNRLTNQIYYFDINEDRFYQVTDDEFNNHSPMWDSTGTKILFISEEDNISNYHVIDLLKGVRAVMTQVLTGVFGGHLNYKNDLLIIPVYYSNGWNIYTHRNPLDNLNYISYKKPQMTFMDEDFDDQFQLYRYRYYGYKEDFFSINDEDVEPDELTYLSSTASQNLHPKPNVVNEPKIEPYKVRFHLDRLWGGAAYSSTYGTIGNLQLGFSDMMGDHTIGVQFGLKGELKYSDLIFSYLYLPRRIDYGLGIFNLNDDYILYYPQTEEYISVRERDAGLYSLIRYPLNRFWRIDLENYVYRHQQYLEIWDGRSDNWQELYDETGYVYSPQLRLVHDNVLFAYTGPISGWRGFLAFNKSFSRTYDEFFTIRSDIRSYTLFSKNYSFVTRLNLGKSRGENPQKFRIDGYYGVRGLTELKRGRNKAVGTLELRFPFIDRINMQFPLPMSLKNIRGSIFTDIGAVWDDSFRGMKDGVLEDLVIGFGMGPRINLGFLVMKLDIAWNSDLTSAGRPTYYLSINEEF